MRVDSSGRAPPRVRRRSGSRRSSSAEGCSANSSAPERLASLARSSSERHRGMDSARSADSVRSTRSPPAVRALPPLDLSPVSWSPGYGPPPTSGALVPAGSACANIATRHPPPRGDPLPAGRAPVEWQARHRCPLFHIGARMPSRSRGSRGHRPAVLVRHAPTAIRTTSVGTPATAASRLLSAAASRCPSARAPVA